MKEEGVNWMVLLKLAFMVSLTLSIDFLSFLLADSEYTLLSSKSTLNLFRLTSIEWAGLM